MDRTWLVVPLLYRGPLAAVTPIASPEALLFVSCGPEEALTPPSPIVIVKLEQMLIRIQPHSEVPIFQQIVHEIRGLIAKGGLKVGDRLPSGRALASSLDVNMHTVLRAYADLRDAGWVEMRRGRGVRVLGAQVPRAELESAADRLIELAFQAQMGQQDLFDLLSPRFERRLEKDHE